MQAEPPAATRARPALPWRPYAVGTILISLLVALLAGLAIWTERQRYRERADVATQNMARLLDAHVSDMFDKVDIFLQATAAHYVEHFPQGGGDPDSVNRLLATERLGALVLTSLRIADAQGLVAYGQGVPRGPAVSIADREYFRRARDQAGSALVVDGPVFARISGQWVIVLARALRGPDGRFLGIVYANLATDQFGRLFAELQLGRFGAAALRGADLALIHREPSNAESRNAIGSTDVSAELRRAIAQAPLGGTYLAAKAFDGVERSNAYRRVGRYPFYVIIGVASDDYLADWRTNAALFAALAGSIVALTVVAGTALYRGSRRRLDAMARHFEAIVETSADAIIGLTPEGTVTSWNGGAEDIFGYRADEMVGQPLQRLLPPDRPDEQGALLARIARGERVEPFETQRLRRSGRLVHVSIGLSPLYDAQGRIAGASLIARDIGRQKAMEEEIRAMAFNDALTRLPNRRLLLDRLRRAQLASTRQRSFYAVLFIDLDDFKRINDQFGHDAGDRLLVEVAGRLQLAVRQNDTVARLGGDEFVLVLEDLGGEEQTAVDHANTVADKVLDMIEQDYLLGDVRQRCSASIGIKLAYGSAPGAEQVLKEADAAMYRVKNQRRDLTHGVFE